MIVGGSDWDVSSYNPFRAMQHAVTRTERGRGYEPLNIDERISIGTAIDAYTINAAFAMKQDATTGSLAVGKRADLVILDRDILSVDLRLLRTPWCLPPISTDASFIPLCRRLSGKRVTYVFKSGSVAIEFVSAASIAWRYSPLTDEPRPSSAPWPGRVSGFIADPREQITITTGQRDD